MVHPDFRRRGIGTRLLKEAKAFWKQGGASAIFALPNEKWDSIQRATGWRLLYPLRVLHFPIHPNLHIGRGMRTSRPGVLARLSSCWFDLQRYRHRADSGIVIERMEKPLDAIDRLSESILQEPYLGALHDRSWIAYRYFDSRAPTYHVFAALQNGDPVGCLVMRIKEDGSTIHAHIADLLTRSKDSPTGSRLCLHAIMVARAAGASAVIAGSVPRTHAYAAYRAAGFIPGRHAFPVKVSTLNPEFSTETLESRSELYLSSGDFDIV